MKNGGIRKDVNFVLASGRITEEFQISHFQNGKTFLKTNLSVPRLSGIEDTVPIVIESSMLKKDVAVGSYAEVNGRFCSFLKHDGKSVERYVFVSNMSITDREEELEFPIGTNEIFLDGRLKFDPIYRKTPLGRTISEFTLACFRKNKKNTDRIPCVAWGDTAMKIAGMPVDSRMKVTGRIQSRTYLKNQEKKTFYEVSVQKCCTK